MQGSPTRLGRYELWHPIGSGGMATVYLGRAVGVGGFSRLVAIKRARPELASDPEFATMFLDEARMASCIRHPNVVSILDVVEGDGELLLVMDYVDGEPLSNLVKLAHVPLDVVSRILVDVLEGLEAAHEANGPRGRPLGLVHRDVSPSNMLVGADGITRLIDFGVAKAAGRLRTTCNGDVKGKLGYLAPEQILGKPVTRRTDLWAASVVLWELLANRRLFHSGDDSDVLQRILFEEVRPPSAYASIPAELDDLVARGLSHDQERRFASAREMANALARCVPPCSPGVAAEWVARVAGEPLRARMEEVVAWERTVGLPPRAPKPETELPAVAAPANVGRSRARVGVAVAALAAFVAIGSLVARRAEHADARAATPPPSALENESLPATRSEALTPPTGATPTTGSAAAPPTRARAAPAPKKRPDRASDCDVPYVVDANGNRTYKRECL